MEDQGNVAFPKQCPVCNRDLVFRANIKDPSKPRVEMFHKDDDSPLCPGAYLPPEDTK